MAMVNINLRRTGDRLIQFTGQIISMASTRKITGMESERWLEIELYLTVGNKYVVAVSYKTRCKGELSHDTAVSS